MVQKSFGSLAISQDIGIFIFFDRISQGLDSIVMSRMCPNVLHPFLLGKILLHYILSSSVSKLLSADAYSLFISYISLEVQLPVFDLVCLKRLLKITQLAHANLPKCRYRATLQFHYVKFLGYILWAKCPFIEPIGPPCYQFIPRRIFQD